MRGLSRRFVGLFLCLTMLTMGLAVAMPAPAAAEVVAKQAGAHVVSLDQLPQPAAPAALEQLQQLQGEGIIDIALGVAVGVLVAALVIWAVN